MARDSALSARREMRAGDRPLQLLDDGAHQVSMLCRRSIRGRGDSRYGGCVSDVQPSVRDDSLEVSKKSSSVSLSPEI
jgi:hypothetical protein